MAEEIRFPIVGEDRGATRVLKDVGRESAVTAAQTRILAESLDAEKRAATSATDALYKVEKAAALVAITERELQKEADKAERAMVSQAEAARVLGSSSKDAAGKNGLAALAGSGGIAGGGMGALIAAGVALSPVIATVGTGLGGLALAALAAGKNSQQLKAELVPLKADFAAFGKSVQPTLVSDFAAAASLAGHVLKDIRPVTVATGAALRQMLLGVDKEFKSGTWQQFFGFMQRTAGPDMALLTQNITDLLQALPPLVEDLQPLATGLLHVSDDAVKAAGGIVKFYDSFQKNVPISNQHTSNFLKDLDRDVVSLTDHIPGAKAVNDWLTNVQHSVSGAGAAEKAAAPAVSRVTQDYAAQAKALNTLAASYEHGLTPLENYIGAQITERNDLVTLNQDLKKSHDAIGLKTQAERNSFGAAEQYIKDTLAQGNAALAAKKGIDGQISSIRNALPALENVKGKTAAYKQELQLLKGILDKLRTERAIRENVVVTGSGTWHEAMFHSGVGHAVGPAGAQGAFIRQGTTATADDVIARVSKGELIVPSKMVAAGLVDHLRGSIPGFASGGIIPSYHGSPAGLPPWTSHNQKATVSAITAAIAKGFASAFMSGPSGAGPARHAAIPYLESLWDAAGGPPGLAHLMAAIAMAESGGNPAAYNPSGATGLWQILGAVDPRDQPFLRNPAVNAHEAVLKYRSQGLGAWVTYTSGAYRQYYDRGGWLRPGLTLAYNGTGRPEQVLSPQSSAGQTININVHVSADASMHPAETGRVIAEKLKAHVKRGGSLYPAGMTPR